MTDDGAITNRILLDHIMVNTGAIDRLSRRVDGLSGSVDGLSQRVDRLEEKMDRKFEEAKQHRDNLQEDLEATILMQFKHQKQLAMITGEPMPEEY